MIIWRGWGVIAFGFILATGILGIGLPYNLWGTEASRWMFPAVAVLAGIGCWFSGVYLNVTKPNRIAEVEIPRLRAEVRATVEAGAFRLPNQPPPMSLAEARGQAEAYLQVVEAQLHTRKNQHTLFFIPVQYWAFLIVLWGIAMPFLLK